MNIRKSFVKKSNTGYIYGDGIVLIESKTIGRGKYKQEILIAHIFEMDVDVSAKAYRGVRTFDCDEVKVHSIILYDPNILLLGIEKIEIVVNDKSDKMRELGNVTDNVAIQWYTKSGAIVKTMEFDFMHTDYSVIFEDVTNPANRYSVGRGPGSIKDWDDTSGFIVEKH